MLHEETWKLVGNLSFSAVSRLIFFTSCWKQLVISTGDWGFKCWTEHCRATWQTGSRVSNQFFCPKGQGKPTLKKNSIAKNPSWAGQSLIPNNNNYNFEWSSSSHNAFFLCIELMTLLHTARRAWLSSPYVQHVSNVGHMMLISYRIGHCWSFVSNKLQETAFPTRCHKDKESNDDSK